MPTPSPGNPRGLSWCSKGKEGISRLQPSAPHGFAIAVCCWSGSGWHRSQVRQFLVQSALLACQHSAVQTPLSSASLHVKDSCKAVSSVKCSCKLTTRVELRASSNSLLGGMQTAMYPITSSPKHWDLASPTDYWGRGGSILLFFVCSAHGFARRTDMLLITDLVKHTLDN